MDWQGRAGQGSHRDYQGSIDSQDRVETVRVPIDSQGSDRVETVRAPIDSQGSDRVETVRGSIE